MVALICVLMTTAIAYAQFGRGGRFGFGARRIATAQDFDGRFHYCRVVYRQALDGAGGSWRTDYPRGDINFSILRADQGERQLRRRARATPPAREPRRP